jgi:DNA modification methylase
MNGINNGVSIFDPVLAEIILKWFNIENGKVFDCFAGDSAVGFIASTLGMEFTGIEIRPEQVELNNQRMRNTNARYICDDGQNVGKYFEPESQDLFFSCPPYFDLENYSDLPNDASNQSSYGEFLAILQNAFISAIKCLKEDRFAVIVVGDIRDKEGFYYGFPDDVKSIFRNEGVRLYNELVLVESLGTLPQRVGKYMKSRKIGKCHQNVLVFYKGNPKNIAKNFKEIKYTQSDLDAFVELN